MQIQKLELEIGGMAAELKYQLGKTSPPPSTPVWKFQLNLPNLFQRKFNTLFAKVQEYTKWRRKKKNGKEAVRLTAWGGGGGAPPLQPDRFYLWKF